MTFTVGVYRNGSGPDDGWRWVVRSGADDVVADGLVLSWSEAVVVATAVMTAELHHAYGQPAHVYRLA